MKITLETERLILRPFEYEDKEAMFYNWTSDIEVTKYLTWSPHQSIEQTFNLLNIWIEQYKKAERINFGIVLKETNELIGGIDVVGYEDGIPIIGYVLSRKYWNCGYMSEACLKLIDFLFLLGHNKIRIDAVKENIASNKVIQKCGGTFVGQFEDKFEKNQQTVLINKYVINKQK